MDKMLVAVFSTESGAYEGRKALQDLDWSGDITLYGTAIVAKDDAGTVSMKQKPDNGPLATGVGVFAGALLGLLGGALVAPVGAAAGAAYAAAATAGAAGGALGGSIIDATHYGFSLDVVDEVSTYLVPGTAALLAEIDETWRVPVDTRLGELNAVVFRRPISEVADDQLVRESAEIDGEMRDLEAEIESANAKNKAALEAQLDRAKKRAESLQKTVSERLTRAKTETDAKVNALQEQLKHANEDQKARIEKRIAEVKADYQRRSELLEEARPLIKEAVRP